MGASVGAVRPAPRVLRVGIRAMVLIVMAAPKLDEFFERNPAICGGQPVFRGTRILLRTVLASLADGDTSDDILAAFPTLTLEQLRAAIAFAASSAQEDLPVPGLPRF